MSIYSIPKERVLHHIKIKFKFNLRHSECINSFCLLRLLTSSGTLSIDVCMYVCKAKTYMCWYVTYIYMRTSIWIHIYANFYISHRSYQPFIVRLFEGFPNRSVYFFGISYWYGKRIYFFGISASLRWINNGICVSWI